MNNKLTWEIDITTRYNKDTDSVGYSATLMLNGVATFRVSDESRAMSLAHNVDEARMIATKHLRRAVGYLFAAYFDPEHYTWQHAVCLDEDDYSEIYTGFVFTEHDGRWLAIYSDGYQADVITTDDSLVSLKTILRNTFLEVAR